jgi:ferrous iron transport protein B
MRFALAGNPNSGKTTLFNALTGGTARVGNWPGVTVDKKTGTYKKLPEPAEIVDLPGIYSLSPYTPEEVVSRNFVLEEKPDAVINIVDATNLERNLYLTTQLLELDIPVVIALNMMDAVGKSGDVIDIPRLEKAAGVPVAAITALTGQGVKELMEKVYAAAKTGRKGVSVLRGTDAAGKLYGDILALYEARNVANAVFHAVKMLEGDELETAGYADIAAEAARRKAGIDTGIFEGDFEGVVADRRYRYITDHYTKYLDKKRKSHELTRSDKIDRVLTHKIWGIPIFLFIMLAVFHCVFSENFLFIGSFIAGGSFDIPVIGTDTINSPGVMLAEAMGLFTETVRSAADGAMPAGTWYTSLVVNGVLDSVFAVLSFIPQILCLFLFLSILEDSGYMARVAFIMDRAFRRFGLSGKAFMPLLMCFGCAVPGIMATRTLESEQERKRTIMLAPFFSCGAKLPIWAAFAGVFAQEFSGLNAELVVYSMYLLGIAVAVAATFVLKNTLIKGATPQFIMELPAYHAPQFKNTMLYLWRKLKHFIFRAATVIAGASVVIWFLSSFTFSFQLIQASEELTAADSIIGVIGRGLEWLFVPLGFGMGENGWKFIVAALTGLLAKEVTVATMGVFAGVDGDEALEMGGEEIHGSALGVMMLSIGGTFAGMNVSIPAMFAFMAFNLLTVPCMAAVAAARAELRSAKSLWTAIGFWMLTAYGVSLVIFWYGVFITANPWPALAVGVFLLAAAIAAPLLFRYVKRKKGAPGGIKEA